MMKYSRFSDDYGELKQATFCQHGRQPEVNPGADPDRGESGSSHGQIFSTLEYFALTFLKILD